MRESLGDCAERRAIDSPAAYHRARGRPDNQLSCICACTTAEGVIFLQHIPFRSPTSGPRAGRGDLAPWNHDACVARRQPPTRGGLVNLPGTRCAVSRPRYPSDGVATVSCFVLSAPSRDAVDVSGGGAFSSRAGNTLALCFNPEPIGCVGAHASRQGRSSRLSHSALSSGNEAAYARMCIVFPLPSTSSCEQYCL